MLLSEAIRLGSTLLPQGFGVERTGRTACALDAAVLGAGLNPCLPEQAIQKWPELKMVVKCPACRKKDELGNMLIHLNDDHFWGRVRIADWLDHFTVAWRHPFTGAPCSFLSFASAWLKTKGICFVEWCLDRAMDISMLIRRLLLRLRLWHEMRSDLCPACALPLKEYPYTGGMYCPRCGSTGSTPAPETRPLSR